MDLAARTVDQGGRAPRGTSAAPPGTRGMWRGVAVVCTLAALAALVWGAALWTRERVLAELSAEGAQQLRLFESSLRSEIERYEFLPQVLARDERVARLLESPLDPRRVDQVNRFLAAVNDNAGASATYVMDRDGLTLAASNWRQARTFVGRNFSFRPYFRDAVAGRPGRYFALGTTSLKRGYYYANPVMRGDRVLGVTVVKVSFERVEAAWRRAPEAIAVTDYDGVIFITNQPRWRFRTMSRLGPETIARIRASRQYQDQPLDPLPIVSDEPIRQGGRLVTLRTPEHAAPGGERDRLFLVQTAQLPTQRLNVHVMVSTESLPGAIASATAVATLLAALLVLGAFYLAQRRRNWVERMAHQRDVEDTLRRARAELEARVRERTAQLTATNQRLDQRVTEHERTEADLRRTQDELVQAAKLAALGQLAAGVTHELNQPLTAIRSFADNAQVLIERGRGEDAAHNLETIASLVERMAVITSQLKSFARRSDRALETVDVAAAIEEVLGLAAPRLRGADIALTRTAPDEAVMVHADRVRLEQVLLNLVNNAIDALASAAVRELSITMLASDDTVTVTVADSGAGIAPEALEALFDPFFTTKPVGEGLGLGLSISDSIVRDFGGQIRACNRSGHGAEFTVTLPRADRRAVA